MQYTGGADLHRGPGLAHQQSARVRARQRFILKPPRFLAVSPEGSKLQPYCVALTIEPLELHRRSGRRQTRYRQICVKVGDLNWRTRLANGYNYSACANSKSKACQNARAAYAEHHNGKLLSYTTITGIRGDRDAGASRVRTGDGSSRQRRPSPAPLATQWC